MLFKNKKLISTAIASLSLTGMFSSAFADTSLGGWLFSSLNGSSGSLPLNFRQSFSSTSPNNTNPLDDLTDFFTGGSTSSLRLFEVGTLGSNWNSTALGSAFQSGGSIGSGIRTGLGGSALGSAGSAIMTGLMGNGVESGNSLGRSPFLAVAASFPIGSGVLLGSFNSLIGSNPGKLTFGLDADSIGAKSYVSPQMSLGGVLGSWLSSFPLQSTEWSNSFNALTLGTGTESAPSSLLGVPAGSVLYSPSLASTSLPFYSLDYLAGSLVHPLGPFIPTLKIGSWNSTASIHSVKKIENKGLISTRRNQVKSPIIELRHPNILLQRANQISGLSNLMAGFCVLGHNGQGGCNGGGVGNQFLDGAAGALATGTGVGVGTGVATTPLGGVVAGTAVVAAGGIGNVISHRGGK